jgi:hypothetical protein
VRIDEAFCQEKDTLFFSSTLHCCPVFCTCLYRISATLQDIVMAIFCGVPPFLQENVRGGNVLKCVTTSYIAVSSVVYWVACWPLVPKIAGRSRRKIHSMPSFGGEVKPSVPCRIFAACKRTPPFTWKSESQAKLTGHFSPSSVLH